MSPPLVSVVIPSYNCAPYVLEAIRSAAEQTYENRELIVVDDCSSDNSCELISQNKEQIATRFPGGFTFLRNQMNLGAHATLNIGSRLAKGKYIFLLNSDDAYEPNRLESMVKAMGESDASLAFSSVRCIDAHGDPASKDDSWKFESLPERIDAYPFAAAAAAVENISVSSGNLAFTRELFDTLGGFRPFLYVHDYDFFFRGCLETEPAFVRRTAYLYRLHETNSFLSLGDVGKDENRLIWLERYADIRCGNVRNTAILSRAAYADEFYRAVSKYGPRKRALYRGCLSPLAGAIRRGLWARIYERADRSL